MTIIWLSNVLNSGEIHCESEMSVIRAQQSYQTGACTRSFQNGVKQPYEIRNKKRVCSSDIVSGDCFWIANVPGKMI